MDNIVSKGVTRVDAYAKVIGEAEHTLDLEPRGCSCARVVHSTVASGLVKRFDLGDALKVPGAVEIVTCFDVPNYQFPTADHPQSMEAVHQDIGGRGLLNRRVRLYGDDIAAVITSDDVTYRQTARLIKVEYERYRPMVTVEQAVAEDITPLYPDLRKDNVAIHSRLTMGLEGFTFEGELREAKEKYGKGNLTVLRWEYHIPRISHCRIELPVSWAYQELGSKIAVTFSTQIPHIVCRVTSQVLGLPVGKIGVIRLYIGGGFGNKQDMSYEPLDACLTTVVGRHPVRLETSRKETICDTGTHHTIDGKCKALATKDEKMLARRLEAYANNGGYASHGHTICTDCGDVSKGAYQDRLGAGIGCYTVWTPTATAGATRGYGIPQTAFLSECLTDDVCQAVGADPLTFHMKNCTEERFTDPTNGTAFHSYDPKKRMEEGVKYIGWKEKRRACANQIDPVRRGVGVTIFCHKAGVCPISLETASTGVILNQDGSIQPQSGATEIGRGINTAFSQMAAEATGISLGRAYIISTQDTDTAPFDIGAYASCQAYVTDVVVKKYAQQLKARILDYAGFMLRSHPAEKMGMAHNHIVEEVTEKEFLDVGTLALTAFHSLERSEHVTAEVTNQCKGNSFSLGYCFVEVEVNTPPGQVTVEDIVNVHDSGVLTNPELAEARVHGGIPMDLGYGLSEELLYNDTNRPPSDSLSDYKVPTAMDIPDLHVRFIQLEGPTDPYGNKSLGESPAIPVAPTLCNVVLRAVGATMDTIPVTPQKLIETFQTKGLIQSCNG